MHTGSPSARTTARRFPSLPLLGAGFLLLLIVPGMIPPASAHGTEAFPIPLPPLANGPCGGAHVASSFAGTLGVEGGSSPPSVANLTIRALYDYQLQYTPKGGTTTTSCSTGSATATTDSQGAFAVVLSIPSSGCTVGGCSNYSGPFGPTSFSVASSTPAGYFVASNVSGTTVTLDFVFALGSAGLTPFGRTTVSALAPVTLSASGLAGNGAVSPATLTYAWLMTGTGWAIVSGSGTSRLTVTSSTGAGVATIVVYVNGTYNGTAESAAPRSALLTAAATSLIAESVNPTSIDVGAPATFSLTGSGAAGYTYSATIFPGLGLAPVTRTCVPSPANGGYVTLACTVVVTYLTAGTVQPSANLTNGYSSAAVTFSPVTVAPGLSLVLTPSPAQGYVGTPLAFTVSVSGGTGTAPYGPACFWPGDGSLACAPLGASQWTFPVTFGYAGRFVGTATVVDAAGENRSVGVVTLVSNVPALGALSGGPSKITAGTPYRVTSDYAGGALPATYWWNDSLPGTTLARGVLTQDGPLNFTYVPTLAGNHLLRLTVVDALGTVKSALLPLRVTAGPPTAIATEGGGGAWTTVAGSPYNVTWAVVDPAGEIVPTAGENLTLTPLSSAGPLWVNLTGWGPLTPGAGGAFRFSASDWGGGCLNFSVDSPTAGAVVFAVGSALPVSGTVNGTVRLTVTYDRLHLVLRDPLSLPTGDWNRTRWQISDRFLNPVPAGYIVVETNVSGVVSENQSPVLFNGTVSVVWVNYSLPSGVGATVLVWSAWDQELLPPLVVAAPAPASLFEIGLLALFVLAAAACLAMGIRARRPDPDPRAAAAPTAGDRAAEAELRRLATGREFVLSRADPTTPRELADLVRGFPGIPPTPTELAEWVGSLVNEGELKASLGGDGKPRFLRRRPDEPVDAATSAPRVELDPKVLEAALAQRPERDPSEDDPDAAPSSD